MHKTSQNTKSMMYVGKRAYLLICYTMQQAFAHAQSKEIMEGENRKKEQKKETMLPRPAVYN